MLSNLISKTQWVLNGLADDTYNDASIRKKDDGDTEQLQGVKIDSDPLPTQYNPSKQSTPYTGQEEGQTRAWYHEQEKHQQEEDQSDDSGNILDKLLGGFLNETTSLPGAEDDAYSVIKCYDIDGVWNVRSIQLYCDRTFGDDAPPLYNVDLQWRHRGEPMRWHGVLCQKSHPLVTHLHQLNPDNNNNNNDGEALSQRFSALKRHVVSYRGTALYALADYLLQNGTSVGHASEPLIPASPSSPSYDTHVALDTENDPDNIYSPKSRNNYVYVARRNGIASSDEEEDNDGDDSDDSHGGPHGMSNFAGMYKVTHRTRNYSRFRKRTGWWNSWDYDSPEDEDDHGDDEDEDDLINTHVMFDTIGRTVKRALGADIDANDNNELETLVERVCEAQSISDSSARLWIAKNITDYDWCMVSASIVIPLCRPEIFGVKSLSH